MGEQDIMEASGVATDINQHFMVIKDISVDIGISRADINIMVEDMAIYIADTDTTSAVVIIISEAGTDTSEAVIHTPAADIGGAVTEAVVIIDDP